MTIPQLKVLTIVMGVLIVAGVLALAATIAWRAAGIAAPRGPVTLRLPPGATVVETALDGDRLALRLDTAAGPRIAIVDLATGDTVRTVEIAP